MADIVCVGILVVDALGKPVKQFPVKGELVLVDTLTLATGGCAINTAIALKRLGVDVSVIGKIGRDSFGAFLSEELRANGIGTDAVVVSDDTATSFTYVAVFFEIDLHRFSFHV